MSRLFKAILPTAGAYLWRNRSRIQSMIADRRTGPEPVRSGQEANPTLTSV